MTRLLQGATRLHDVTIGKFDQFKRDLAEGNLDGELLEVLLKNPHLTRGMIGWVREQLIPPAVGGRIFDGSNLAGWYGTPEEQLANMHRWNDERGWGFDGLDFPVAPPEFIPTHKQEVLVLVAYLPDEVVGGMRIPGYIRTYNEYVRIIQAEQPGRGFYTSEVDVEKLKLLAGTEDRHQPGIRWMVVDLGAYPNTPPADIRDEHSAHAEVLAVFVQMPAYVNAQRWFESGESLWLPGYQSTDFHGPAWNEAPHIRCSRSPSDINPRNGYNIVYDVPSRLPFGRKSFAPTARQL